MSDDANTPIRGQRRRKGFRRVAHGLFLLDVDHLSAETELRRDLVAWLVLLPEDAVFTGLTAAMLLGWQVPRLPEQVPVFAATSQDRRPRRPGLICSRLRRDSSPGSVDGLPVDSAEEVLLRCARDLELLDLLIVVEGARDAGHVDPERMATVLASGRPGVRLLREAWRRSTGLSESAGETLLQEFHRCLDIAFHPQKKLFDLAGRLVAVADLWIVGTTRLHEYDGAVHRGVRVQRADLRRERGLSSAGYMRRGFTLDDLLNHSLVTMHEIDRDLGRAHVMRRHRAWVRRVEQSMYSPAARERVMNRWHRQMGVGDWSRTTPRAG